MYGPVPFAPAAVAVPVLPLHFTSTWLVVAERATAGSVIVTVFGTVHRFASVTVTVYVPAIKPVAVAVFCAGVVFQEYVYGPVPFAPAAVAVPELLPLHFASTWLVVAERATG